MVDNLSCDDFSKEMYSFKSVRNSGLKSTAINYICNNKLTVTLDVGFVAIISTRQTALYKQLCLVTVYQENVFVPPLLASLHMHMNLVSQIIL